MNENTEARTDHHDDKCDSPETLCADCLSYGEDA